MENQKSSKVEVDTLFREWISTIRSEMASVAPLVCSSCSNQLDQNSVDTALCPNCQYTPSKFISNLESLIPWLLAGCVVALITAGLYAIVDTYASSVKFLQLIDGLGPSGKVLFYLFFSSIALGMTKQLLRTTFQFWTPPSKGQRFARENAKSYIKRNDIKGAARWYAEVLTYDFSLSVFSHRAVAVHCFQNNNLADLPYHDHVQALLFLDGFQGLVLSQHDADDHRKSLYRRQLCTAASDSPKILNLANILSITLSDKLLNEIRPKAPQLVELIEKNKSKS